VHLAVEFYGYPDASERSRKWLPSKVDELLDIPSNQFAREFEKRVEAFIGKCRAAIPRGTTLIDRGPTKEVNLPSVRADPDAPSQQ
jgi:hypothetical protein